MTLRSCIALLIAGVLLLPAYTSAEPGQIGALTTDCSASRYDRVTKSFQFVATCAERALSPDGRLAVVQRAYREKQPTIEVRDVNGRTIARLPSLSDDMPFVVLWSPNSRWIAINHHVGSFMARLRLFEVVGRRVVERPELVRSAVLTATRRYRCLEPDAVLPNAMRWASDSARLVMVTISSLYACSDTAEPGGWWPLWMIGDVRTGRIEPSSIRVDKGNGPFRQPRDRLYKRL